MTESMRYQRWRVYNGVGGRVLLVSGVDMWGDSGRSGGSIDLEEVVKVGLEGCVTKS